MSTSIDSQTASFNQRSILKPAPLARAGSAPSSRGKESTGVSAVCAYKPKVPPLAPGTKPPSNRKISAAATRSSGDGLPRRPKRMLPRDPMASRCSLAMSRTESLLVSASGDVMVCRCRRSSIPYFTNGNGRSGSGMSLMDPWTNIIPCCDTDFIAEGPWSPVFNSLTVLNQKSGESTASEGSTYEWENAQPKQILHKPNRSTSKSTIKETKCSNDSQASSELKKEAREDSDSSPHFQPPTVEALADFNAYSGEIIPLPSFDYDHIHNGQNDMLSSNQTNISNPTSDHHSKQSFQNREVKAQNIPGVLNRRENNRFFPTIVESPEEKKDEQRLDTHETQPRIDDQPFYHGIPIFLAGLSQIRVRKVSSHPLGAHVLLISEEAMLFTYGLNNHGQLGIGIRSDLKDNKRGFHTTPTLITPLLENGGKAINCAAGVEHSLVVVVTEGRRLQRLQTQPGVAYSDHGIQHESPLDAKRKSEGINDNSSVHHHQLYGFGSNDFMKIGLVKARLADDGAEGDGEDILLPRRVALHCTVWPDQDAFEDDGDFPDQGIFDIAAATDHSAALVRRATGDVEIYVWGNATLGALGLPVTPDPDADGNASQRANCNSNNIFPLPTILESLTYRPRNNKSFGFPRQISLGPHSTFVVMSSGRCFSFGFSAEGMLGHGFAQSHTMDAKEIIFPSGVTKSNMVVSIDAGAHHVIALTAHGEAYSWGVNSDDRLGHGTSDYAKIVSKQDLKSSAKENIVMIEWLPQKIDLSLGEKRSGDSVHFIKACAGYDSSMLVTRSGEVYSFGKRSGRLGKGEVTDNISTPQSLHGGLRLFHTASKKSSPMRDPLRKPVLKRILSDSAFGVR